MKITISSREDLDSIEGTPEHKTFMEYLKGTMTRQQDVAIRPDNYGKPDYDGEIIEPVWEYVEDLTTIERFGFKKKDFK